MSEELAGAVERPHEEAVRRLRRTSFTNVALVLLVAGGVWLAGALLEFEVNLWILAALPVALALSWWTALRLRAAERRHYGDGR